jgi:flagellar biosynthetic protein FliP
MSDAVQVVQALSEPGAFQNMAPPLQVAILLGALAFASAALVSATAFTRIIIVLSFVRRAMTTQEVPPNPVLIGLSLFLTLLVMGPTWDEMSANAIGPYLQGRLSGPAAIQEGAGALQKFMLHQTRRHDLALFVHLAGLESLQSPGDVPLRVLVPAFIVSELKTAFLMGFCIYVPFLLVDLVVSTVLMSMGMMMMPPVVISTPFKILLFVLADGWHLVTRALSMSFG